LSKYVAVVLKVAPHLYCFLFCFVLISQNLLSKESSAQTDTLKNESENIVQEAQDTISLNLPLKWLGELVPFKYLDKDCILKSKIVLSDNLSLFDVLKLSTENIGLGLGNLGSFNPFIEYGVIAFPYSKINGSDILIPQLNVSSLELIPLLTFEKVEVFTGVEAITFSHNTNGLLFNSTSRVFNTKLPYTQIWIGQAGYEYLGSSAVVSQNIFPNTNFLFSYQRFWSAGRYANSNADKWNVLVGFRWNLLPNFNFSIENRYTNWGNGLWGGINDSLSIDLFDNTIAEVNFTKLNRRVFYNDLLATYSLFLNADTSLILSGNFSFVYSEMDSEWDTTVFVGPYLGFGFSKMSGRFFESSNRLTLRFNSFKTIFGVDVRSIATPTWQFGTGAKSTVPAIFGLFYFDMLKSTELVVGSRIWYENAKPNFSTGVRISHELSKKIVSYAELNFFPRIANNPKVLSPSPENNLLVRAGIGSHSDDELNFNVRGYYRYVKNKVWFESVGDSVGRVLNVIPIRKNEFQSTGLELSSSYGLVFGFSGESKAYVNYYLGGDKNLESLPNFILSQTIKYTYRRGNSILDLGVNLEILSPFKGMSYVPHWNVFVPYPKRVSWQMNGINLFASAKLGNAYVNLSLRNALGLNFYYIPIYPEYDRNLRISVFWSFFD
jgi:hypothetical protein